MTPFAVLISGRGTNMKAIAESVRSGRLPGRIVLVASDNPDAPGLKTAKRMGLETAVLPYASGRREAESALKELCISRGSEWIVLAGFMRILSPDFVRSFPRRIVNIHPALLPSFPGRDGIGDAWRRGVKVTGVTVHLVDEGVDSGPILAQRPLAIHPGETLERLEKRIHRLEHRIYPETLLALFTGSLPEERRS